MLATAITSLLNALALPTVGLPALFVVALVSATIMPMGSEPAVFAVVKMNGELFWPAVLVATAGNTLGGAISWAMGYGAKRAFAKERETRWFGWLQRFGPKTLLLSWLPVVGDPLCVLAGWLKMPFWPCLLFMAIGKLARYLSMTWLLLEVPDGFWHQMLGWL
ncbi:MAG: DedA family protein [Burkholderiaceae bacterium]|nr:DedA family protein [Burkholderiaceae bacterium]